jgi:hypothetical protein
VMTDYVLECGRPAPQRHAGADPSAQREGGPAMGPRMPGPVVFGEVEQQPLGADVTDDLQAVPDPPVRREPDGRKRSPSR